MGTCFTAGTANPFSQKSLIAIIPNPSADNFVLHLEGGSTCSSFTSRVANITGRLMWETKGNAADLRIEASQTPPCMYLQDENA